MSQTHEAIFQTLKIIMMKEMFQILFFLEIIKVVRKLLSDFVNYIYSKTKRKEESC